MNMIITVISILVGLFGLIATLIGTFVAYISYVNPIKRFGRYLRETKNWEVYKRNDLIPIYTYRHKYFLDFQIEIDFDKPLKANFEEKWIKDYPDKSKKTYNVKLIAKGMLIEEFEFLTLDGYRIFIPLPMVNLSNGVYYYNQLQKDIHKVIDQFNENGEYSLEKFILEQKSRIEIVKNDITKKIIPKLFFGVAFWIEKFFVKHDLV
ncbi:MAG: hypothetical protein L6420_10440 [Elusimicrobia bacterium]|nr:hypothetical protein [Elusimicrobiota bacterium]